MPGQESAEEELDSLRREVLALRELNRSSYGAQDALRDELSAAQEELLSTNEEFRSTNEELQTAKEELQSANEELATTNDELHNRNRELSELNAQVSQARDYAEAIVRTIRQPLLVLDAGLRIVQVNPAYHAAFGGSPALAEHVPLFEVAGEKWNIPELRTCLERIVSAQTSFDDLELRGAFGGPGERVLRMNGRRLEWTDRVLILLVIEDVTERVAALNALRQQERRKDEFLAMLAHELRNPLAPMLSVLQLWERGFPDAEAERHARAILQRQLQQQTRLVDDLLEVARITSGHIELRRGPVDLCALVRGCVEDLRSLLRESERRVSVTLPDAAVWVDGDSTRLAQVVGNLLGNAAKYTRPGGHIVVTLTENDGTAQLKVSDDGIGISPELMPGIFDLFVQEKRASHRAPGGLGLGLTLVRRLVELHGGTVEARSAGVDQGSEFIVRLRASRVQQAPLPLPVRAERNAQPGAPRRILIVDDNVDAAASLASLLGMHGHQVEVTHSGISALGIAPEFEPDVVLLDIGLPGMDGYEVARRMRSVPATRRALLIAVSGYDSPEDRERGREAGFDHHVVKPAGIESLLALIQGAGTRADAAGGAGAFPRSGRPAEERATAGEAATKGTPAAG
jgi:two-component system CheB/CheR fusion protein